MGSWKEENFNCFTAMVRDALDDKDVAASSLLKQLKMNYSLYTKISSSWQV